MTPGAPPSRGLEAVLRRDRTIVAGSLAALVALAWAYLVVDARRMAAMATAMPDMGAGSLGFAIVMWGVMMVGMMLPSAAPMILLYASLARRSRERGSVMPATWVFTGGYLAAWLAFSVAAALLQHALERAALLTPMLASASHVLTGVILIAAGIYQALPVKRACLAKCREPMQFLLMHWRSGTLGALRMGALHGAWCIGCCWMLMLLLFTAGVMNLFWVALIAAFVLAEKLLPAPRVVSNLAMAALVAAGVWVLLTTP